jgi:hypothetical protein
MKHHLFHHNVILKRLVLKVDQPLNLVLFLGVLITASFALALFASNQLLEALGLKLHQPCVIAGV